MTKNSGQHPDFEDWLEAEWTPAALGHRHQSRLPVQPGLTRFQLAIAEEELWRLLHDNGIRDVTMRIDDQRLLVTIDAARSDLIECHTNSRLASAANQAITRARQPLRTGERASRSSDSERATGAASAAKTPDAQVWRSRPPVARYCTDD